MAYRFLRDPEADGWERSDFPLICKTCFGDNPDVRMVQFFMILLLIRAQFDKDCKICRQPFIVFCWRPGRNARF